MLTIIKGIAVLVLCMYAGAMTQANGQSSDILLAEEVQDIGPGPGDDLVEEGTIETETAPPDVMEPADIFQDFIYVGSEKSEIEDPDQYWEENGYPEDVSYVTEAGGETQDDGTKITYWVVGAVDVDKGRMQEIADVFSSTCKFKFEKAKYPYSERKRVYDEIVAKDDNKILSVDLMKTLDLVHVMVAPENVEFYAEQMAEEYGTRVVVSEDPKAVDVSTLEEDTVDIINEETIEEESEAVESKYYTLKKARWGGVFIVCFGVVIIIIIFGIRRQYVKRKDEE